MKIAEISKADCHKDLVIEDWPNAVRAILYRHVAVTGVNKNAPTEKREKYLH